ncbi:MAG: hypothetical protein RMJ19_10835 [Gemmatales bacterium]|nr:hypothetical protein [Gemmatales bacterium]MDW8176157.1 hypothetical protein [Gemmatales bacterium]
MDEADLIGFLLDLLEDEERQAVEEKLAESSAVQQQLDALAHLMRLLSVLEDDPPPDLAARTVEALLVSATTLPRALNASPRNLPLSVHLRNQPLPEEADYLEPSESLKPGRNYSATRFTWRFVDILVLGVLVLLIGALIPPAVLQARHWERVLACQNNLRRFHVCLHQYAQQNTYFPIAEERGPLAHAGVFVLLLRHSGLWDHDLTVTCPAKIHARSRPQEELPTLREFTQWGSCQDEDLRRKYEEWRYRLSGCYAYHLGYRNDRQQLCGLTLQDDDCLPILGDRPTRPEEDPDWFAKNSPNHSGRGQNVLYVGGHVKFQRCRSCGHARDDIYLNRQRQLAAGCDRYDVVLAPSEASPTGQGALLAQGR